MKLKQLRDGISSVIPLGRGLLQGTSLFFLIEENITGDFFISNLFPPHGFSSLNVFLFLCSRVLLCLKLSSSQFFFVVLVPSTRTRRRRAWQALNMLV